jgi:hypothetical protein
MEPKLTVDQFVQRAGSPHIYTVRHVLSAKNKPAEYVIVDGLGAQSVVAEADLTLFDNARYGSEMPIVAEIRRIIITNSSPTRAHGGHHEGQAGYVLYERDRLPTVIAQLLALLHGSDLLRQKQDHIDELHHALAQEIGKRRQLEGRIRAMHRQGSDALGEPMQAQCDAPDQNAGDMWLKNTNHMV